MHAKALRAQGPATHQQQHLLLRDHPGLMEQAWRLPLNIPLQTLCMRGRTGAGEAANSKAIKRQPAPDATPARPCKRRTHLVGRSGCWLVVSGGVCGLVPVVCLAAGAVMQAHPAIGQTGAVNRADGGHGEVVQTNERVAACCESAAAVWCMKGAGSCTALGACVVTTTSTYMRR